MYLKIITPVVTEPLTITEVKRHIRIYEDGYDSTQVDTITSRVATIGAITGTTVDVQGSSATMYINIGSVSAGGKLDVILQHSDDDVTYTTYEAFTQISQAGASSKIYEGEKRYIRAYATVTVNSVTFSANVDILTGDPADDAELSDIITRAREHAEEYTRLSFAPVTLEMALDSFPSENYINIRHSPLTSVTSVKTLDSGGIETTHSNYIVDSDSMPGRVVLKYGEVWPSGADYPVNPIRIRYVAGYTTLPQRLKQILLYHVNLLYDYREGIPEDKLSQLHRMYDFYRLSWFGGDY